MKKWLIRIGIFFFTIFFAGEIIGRYLGLTSLSLYQFDKDYEYIPQPNQNTLVYRHKYKTNQYSMRSDPLNTEDTCNILVIGDSVIYGGNSIDQDSLATTIVEKMIMAKLKKRIRVLNISAQSWGPDNEAAYLKKNGTFHAKLIILVVSSHDAHDNMTFKPVVGIAPYYDRNSFLAWPKIIEKGWPYIISKILPAQEKKDNLLIDDNEKSFNSGFAYFNSFMQKNHIPVLVYLHSQADELANKGYIKGGSEIINFCVQNHMPLIKGIEKEKDYLYADQIHYNNRGQKFLCNILYPYILRYLR